MEKNGETKLPEGMSSTPEEQLRAYEQNISWLGGRSDRYKFYLIIFSIMCIVCIAFLIINYTVTFVNMSNFLKVVLWITVFFSFFISLVISSRYTEMKGRLSRRIAARDSLKELSLGLKKKFGYFDRLVKINLDNLNDYYELVKVHTRKSFNLSAAVGVIGFLIIIIAISFGYWKKEFKDISYVTAGAGVIVEMISSIFFYLYNRTVRQLKEYHDSLLGVQNILLSFKLVNEDIKKGEGKLPIIDKMIEFLLGSKPFGTSQPPESKIEEVIKKAEKIIK